MPVVANILFLILVLVLVAPALGLEVLTANAEAEEETQQRDACEEAEGQGLAFGLDLSRGGEERAGDEGARGTACGGEGLGQAVEGAEDVVVGC